MSAIKVAIIALVVGALGALAVIFTPSWFPVQAATQARRQDELYLALMIMSSFIFAIVAVFLGYSMWRFRAKPGDESDGPPVHGHTVLEVVWTLIPTAIVIGFAVAGGIILSKNESLASDHLTVDVTGQQFVWTFSYPGTKVHSGILELPVGRDVEFKLHAPPNDVIHEFYIPAFRVGEDVVPGHPTTLIAHPTRIGTYVVECLELCGIGHSQMRAVVNVVTPSAYTAWIAQQQKLATQPPPSSSGPVDAKAVFTQNCGSCHTLSAAGTSGTIGPNLDNLASDAAKYGNGASVAQYVRDSIVDPSKVVVSGYPDSVMPGTFGTQLSSAEIDALVNLLTKGGS